MKLKEALIPSESLVPYAEQAVPKDLEPHQRLAEGIDPKAFLRRSPLERCTPEELAEAILRYYWRRREAEKDRIVTHMDGSEHTVKEFTQTRFPMLSDVARVFGITKNELLALGKQFPESIGRALEAAIDVTDEYIVHGTLEGRYNPQAVALIAPNVSRIKPKHSLEIEDKTKRIPSILDEIEKQSNPYGRDLAEAT